MPVLSNTRHELFAQGIAKGLSETEAYEKAGFKPHRSNPWRLAQNAKVKARVLELNTAGAEIANVSIARVLQELVRIGTSDIRRVMNPDGTLKRVVDLDDDTAASVSSVKVVTRSVGKPDEDGTQEFSHVHELKFWDKGGALEKIGRHLAMFSDRVDLSSSDGTMSPAGELGDTELAARIAQLEKLRNAKQG